MVMHYEKGRYPKYFIVENTMVKDTWAFPKHFS